MRVAEDTLSNQEISDLLDINPKTLTTWKQHPTFIARVDELVAQLQERARRRGLARLDKRQAAQFDRHRRMVDLIDARSTETEGNVPGTDTGLVVTRERMIGSGESQQVVVEYEFDASLMRELRELEKLIAQDAGQWSEKREITGADGAPLRVSYVEVVASTGGDQ